MTIKTPFDKPAEQLSQAPKNVKIISADTYHYVDMVLTQCLSWLKKDAPFTHSASNIRAVDSNVRNALLKLHEDERLFSDNNSLVMRAIKELNK